MKNRIKVVVPFYNPGGYFDVCVESLLKQKYDNFHVYFMDDASTDLSISRIPEDDRFTVIRNAIRKGGALPQLHYFYSKLCDPEDITVVVDGDDWLANKNVLSYINDFYNDTGCMVMYGQCRWHMPEPQFKRFEEKGLAYPLNKQQFIDLRKSVSWPFSHIRTFRAKAYHEIKNQDTNYDCIRDKNGEIYTIGAGDFGVFLPVVEIVGYDNVKYNDKILYVYNRDTNLNEDKVHSSQDQSNAHWEVNKKKSFKQVF
jgi:glycosyltransferase involved in cell wall biosynthesis